MLQGSDERMPNGLEPTLNLVAATPTFVREVASPARSSRNRFDAVFSESRTASRENCAVASNLQRCGDRITADVKRLQDTSDNMFRLAEGVPCCTVARNAGNNLHHPQRTKEHVS